MSKTPINTLWATALLAGALNLPGLALANGHDGDGHWEGRHGWRHEGHHDHWGRERHRYWGRERGVVVVPQPVYVAPRPMVVTPEPVYVAPRPMVVTPWAPVLGINLVLPLHW